MGAVMVNRGHVGMIGILIVTILLIWTTYRHISSGSAFPIPNNQCTISPHNDLRILPLGDSITAGWGGTSGAAWRGPLLKLLEADCEGRAIRYIGSQTSTDPEGNDAMEGWPGYTIAQILKDVQPALFSSLAMKPNVVLLQAGTNDCSNYEHPERWEDAPKRLGQLIDKVLQAVPYTTLIVAKVPSSTLPGYKEKIPVMNSGLSDVVAQRARKGYKILLIDNSGIGADGKDLEDGVHPNDNGYKKLAANWYKGLQEVSAKDWIRTLEEMDAS